MALINLPDPRATLSRMDKLAMGADCTRHPLLGCVIGHGNGTPEQQARNFLHSIWNAARVSFVTGETEGEKKWRLQKIQAELQEWMNKLETWERSNVVVLPQPHASYPVSITERPLPPAPPKLTGASAAEARTLEKLRTQKRDHETTTAAVAEREGTTTH
jgi:hypothetical protein